jgi:transcriptional regulator with XRE-family HTH domain
MREFTNCTTIFPSGESPRGSEYAVTGPSIRLSSPLHQTSALLAFLGLVAGTGRTFGPSAVYDIQRTSNVSYHVSLPSSVRGVFLGIREKLVATRHYFGLSVTDLARVLRVGRPTVYSWIREQSLPSRIHVKRIEALANLAEEWRIMLPHSVKSQLQARVSGRKSLLDYLSEEQLDEQAIRHTLTILKGRLEQQQETRSWRDRSPAEYAKSRGFPEVPRRLFKRNLGPIVGSNRHVS